MMQRCIRNGGLQAAIGFGVGKTGFATYTLSQHNTKDGSFA